MTRVPALLDEHELGAVFDRHYRSAGDRQYRSEFAPVQPLAGTEVEDFQSYVGPGPLRLDWERKNRWLGIVRDEARRGLISRRVRLVSEGPSDYELYEIECCLLLNDEAGDTTFVLHMGEHSIPDEVLRRDFWVINDDLVILMHYDADGRFLGGELIEALDAVAQYVLARTVALGVAEPIGNWWTRHPELHRARRAA